MNFTLDHWVWLIYMITIGSPSKRRGGEERRKASSPVNTEEFMTGDG